VLGRAQLFQDVAPPGDRLREERDHERRREHADAAMATATVASVSGNS
jgi:hypothetical protein